MKITKQMGYTPLDTTITSGDPVFLDTERAPFRVFGLCSPFRRMPKEAAAAVSADVERLSGYPSGGRISFKTDSDYIVIRGEVTGTENQYGIMSPLAITGFDVYERENGKMFLRGVLSPSQGEGKNYVESRLRLPRKMRDIVISLPLFVSLSKVYVALREGSELSAGGDYKYKTPVVFYGSSIVNGVGAGRPGSAYSSIISRMLDTDIINLGFAGVAKAEPAMIDYIATLDMSVFVYDYDHNAPNPDFLSATHYAGYRRFRDARPDVPVIMASKPDYHFSNVEENEKRRQIIISDYKRAVAEGDENILFVDGSEMYGKNTRDDATVDGCHPNDLGAMYMAEAIGKAISHFLEKNK